MSACPCCTVDRMFDARIARRDLASFRRRGPDTVTERLISAVRGVSLRPDASLIDVGGGVGAIHHRLLDAGFARATHVDASSAYLAVAAEEAARIGHESRVDFRHGDLRALAEQLPPADVVTLDRVVCCDADHESLLEAAASRARVLVALSYPRDRWYIRLVISGSNWWRALLGEKFRVYVHSPASIADALARAGLRRTSTNGTFVWAVEVFEREVR